MRVFSKYLLQLGEKHKMAFQSHLSHYKFQVMPFDLTGAPRTFFFLNGTLAPGLR